MLVLGFLVGCDSVIANQDRPFRHRLSNQKHEVKPTQQHKRKEKREPFFFSVAGHHAIVVFSTHRTVSQNEKKILLLHPHTVKQRNKNATQQSWLSSPTVLLIQYSGLLLILLCWFHTPFRTDKETPIFVGFCRLHSCWIGTALCHQLKT